MSKEERNINLLKEIYSGWANTKGGNAEMVMALMDDDVELSSLANGARGAAFTKHCRNREDVREYFDGLLRNWRMIHYTVNEYIADGDNVVAIGHTAWVNKETGKMCETPKVDIWKFSDGRIRALSEYYDTAALLEAAA